MSTESGILVATDLTGASRRVVLFAAHLARLMERHVELVHVADSEGLAMQEPADESVRPYVEQLQARLQTRLDHAAAALEQQRRLCAEVSEGARATLLQGRPWEAVLQRSIESDAAFVVAGPHSAEDDTPETRREAVMGAIRERLLGSTADRLVRHAPCPVWVVPHQVEPNEDSFARWIVSVDFSEASAHAVSVARTLANQSDGSLTLVHVVPPGYSETDEPRHWQEALRQATRREAEEKLQGLMAGDDGARMKYEVRAAEATLHEELLRATEEHRATVLVLGSHGRSGFGHLVLGSTAERCLRRATVPVLVVRKRAV